MTRMNPLRRLAATAAIVGVTAVGGLALAGPALADTTAPASTSTTTVQSSSSSSSVRLGDLLAGLFSKEKSIGSIDLTKVENMTPMTLDDLTAIFDPSVDASPLPTGAVQLKLGALKLTLSAPVAQKVQTVIAHFYTVQGYQVAYNAKGVLVIGKRICDATKSAAWNKDCVVVSATARF